MSAEGVSGSNLQAIHNNFDWKNSEREGVSAYNLQAIHNSVMSPRPGSDGVSDSNLQAIHSQQVKDLFSVAKVRIIYDTTKDKEQKKRTSPPLAVSALFDDSQRAKPLL